MVYKGSRMKVIAFAGEPNTGKSSWINKLAKSKLMTGNWSGVTVEKKEALLLWKQIELHLVDLPGLTGFHGQTDEERITETYLQKEHPDCIVMVMDGCHLKSSLRLCIKIRNFQIPMVGLINFKDEADKNGIHIELEKLSRRLSIPVMYGSSFDDEIREEVLDQIIRQSNKQVTYRPLLNPMADRIFEQYARFHPMKQAIELFEEHHADTALDELESAVNSCMRYCTGNLKQSNDKTIKMDTFLLQKGKGVFLCALLSMFYLMLFAGLKLSEGCTFFSEFVFRVLLDVFSSALPESISLYCEYVLLSGLGTLFGFVPLLFVLHLFHAVIEESGLMARIALLMDHIMRMFHLTGKSFLSFLIAHGCNVPAVIHSTSLENEAIRKKTALLIPFCCCSARFAVLISFVNLIFRKKKMILLLIGYSAGLFVILVLSLCMNWIKNFQVPSQTIIQLPSYRALQWKTLFMKTGYQCLDYIQKIVYVLFLTLSGLWFLMNIEIHGTSLIESFSKSVSFLFAPLGFGKHWIYIASLFPGLIAKEASFGALMMLQGLSNASLSSEYSINLSYLIYLMTTVPCIMTLSALKQRYGRAFAVKSGLLSLCISTVFTWMLYQFIILF